MTRHVDLPVLVVGGNGFIGSRISQNLVESLKWKPIVIDNQEDYGVLDQTQLSTLHSFRKATRLEAEGCYKVHNIDIMNFKKMEAMFKKYTPHSVIHLASFPRQKVVNANPLKATGVMCDALVNMLELAVKYQVKHFMYFSSSMVYGDFDDKVNEDAVCNPKGQYAIMKYMGEQLVKDYNRRHGLQYTIIRPSAVYGPLDVEDRVVSKMLLNAMRGDVIHVNGPNEILDFTYVEDIGKQIPIVLNAPYTSGINQTYNLTACEYDPRTLLDCAKIIKKIVPGSQILVNERDHSFPRRGRLNNNKINMYFENVRRTPLTTGLVAYHAWLKNNIQLFTKTV
jgi:nucleoside-diphosphate-sugar epimerase